MFLDIVYAVVMMIISYALQASMQPKPPNATAGKLDVPTPDAGGLIGVCFGTNIIKSACVAWYGDARTNPIMSEGGGKK